MYRVSSWQNKIIFYIAVLSQFCYLVFSIENNCYDHANRPVRCSPDFINAAFNRPVVATNTCGNQLNTEYCLQSNFRHDYDDFRVEKCDVCDNRIREKSHPSEYLTDYNNQQNLTWWQSDTMEYDIQYPNSVNLTLNLGKSFDITYVQIKFRSSRPESFAIYKRSSENSDWEPYQYYSSNCLETYGLSSKEIVTRDNQVIALCNEEYSDISPLTGGSVAFSTLEGRPNAYNFENDESLKEWVTATDIKITLNRLNTFGDEVFGDPKVLKSYFYAISDIAVGGRCKCNGHANKCDTFQDNNFEEKYKCDCQHNTDGIDCEKCSPFFNDRPWAAATFNEANECIPCNCNGYSNKCVFNLTLYEMTGHGGFCIDCQQNTEGEHCQNCKHGFYRRSDWNNECTDCQCHKDGSISRQCDPEGKCKCKPGVTGDKCDKCLPNYFDLTKEGCKLCSCSEAGSFDSPPVCDARDGKCRCKSNVEGRDCDKCKPGFYHLNGNHSNGCLPCFCFGHSSECISSSNFDEFDMRSNFNSENMNELKALDSYGESVSIGSDTNINNGVFVFSQNKDVWFNLPNKYLGNQRYSYNQDLSFALNFLVSPTTLSRKDLILENKESGLEVYRSIYDSIETHSRLDNADPMNREFKFKLKETEGWRPQLSPRDFQRLLSNLSSIKIKASLGGYTFLNSVSLKTAVVSKTSTSMNPALWIEKCNCPNSHTGQFCENCAVGFRREITSIDPFTRCVPCSCNGHSLKCEESSGKCNCIHQTIGENCERCKEGFYGDALRGTPNDCKPCPCPNNGACAQFFNYQSNSNDVICLDCPLGTRGNLCDICDDGYSISKSSGSNVVCDKCTCNSNIDENAIGNCDSVSGKCLKCIFNTTGDNCEKCLNSYWGNALTDLKCHSCDCSKMGSENSECNLTNGQCTCKKNVIGRECDQCRETYWNIQSGNGCSECKCNPLGSTSLGCNQKTGKCDCKPGITGDKCDECLPFHYGFSSDGCTKCDCDSFGSKNLQCNQKGVCECKENMVGAKCNQCAENLFNFTMGCLKCDDCYNLVQTRVNKLRNKITLLDTSLAKVIPETSSPETIRKNLELQQNLGIIKKKIESVHGSLYDKDMLKSNYVDTLKNVENEIAKIKTDFKELQNPFDEFENKLADFASLEFKLNKTLDDARLVLTPLSQNQDQFNFHLDQVNQTLMNHTLSKNNLKLKEAAALGRKTANEQTDRAKNYQNLIEINAEAARNALDYLNELVDEIDHTQTEDIDYEILDKSAKKLSESASQLKVDLDFRIKSTEGATKKLKDLNLNEKRVDEEIKESNKKAEEFSSKIKQIQSRLKDLNSNAKDYDANSIVDIQKAQQAIHSSMIKDTDMNKLLERSESAKNLSEKSYNIANDAFNNASNILNTLENFKQVIAENKLKAEKAEILKSEINGNLDDARNLSNKVNSANIDLKQNIAKSKANVNKALVDIEKANKNSNLTKVRNDELFNKTKDLNDQVSGLASKYESSVKVIEGAIKKDKIIPRTLSKMQSTAEVMVVNSNNVLNSLINAEEDLKAIENSNVTAINGITKQAIEKLQRKLDETMLDLDNISDLEDSLVDLEERHNRNSEELKFYERGIPLLKQQIADLLLLRSSMENSCIRK